MRNRRSVAGKTLLPPTTRDREIIQAVITHGQMTRAQIQSLYFRKGCGDGADASSIRLMRAKGALLGCRSISTLGERSSEWFCLR